MVFTNIQSTFFSLELLVFVKVFCIKTSKYIRFWLIYHFTAALITEVFSGNNIFSTKGLFLTWQHPVTRQLRLPLCEYHGVGYSKASLSHIKPKAWVGLITCIILNQIKCVSHLAKFLKVLLLIPIQWHVDYQICYDISPECLHP